MLAIDHVIVVVDDLEAAATRLVDRHGLASVVGGRHEGHGTGNRIVPLGPDYLELMAVVDTEEAAGSPLGRWVAARAGADLRPAALCLRTDDVDAVAAARGLTPLEMSRRTPDGRVLSWRLAGLETALGEGLPFFITWDVAPGEHPGRGGAPHRVGVSGIDRVDMGGDPTRLADWLGDEAEGLPVRAVGGIPGVRRVAIATSAGEVVLGE